MEQFTESCLSWAITYKSNSAPLRTFYCYYRDCRKCSGALYHINIFLKEADLDIRGNLKSYIHQSESGNKLTNFCEECGYQIFSFNDDIPGLVRIHTGTVNKLEVVGPQGEVSVSKKISSIKIDETLDQFQKNLT